MKTAFQSFAAAATTRATPGRPWFTISAAADSHTVLIHDQIGKDWWTDDGIASKDFAVEFAKIPAGRKINVRINSNGGSVHDGLAIHNILAERRKDVTVTVDGVAASIASVIALAGHQTIMPRGSLMMIHNPWSRVTGDEHALRKAADMLKTHGEAIANVYEQRTKKSRAEILAAMDAETWMTGDAAVQWGFATAVSDEDVSASISPEILNAAPEAVRVAVQNASRARSVSGANDNRIMNRDQLLALLKRHGVNVPENATDAQLQALLDSTLARASAGSGTPAAGANPTQNQAAAAQPTAAAQPAAPAVSADVIQLQAVVATLQRENAEARRREVAAQVDDCIRQNRVPLAQRETWITRAVADPAVLADLRAMPAVTPGASPVNLSITAEDPNVIVAELGRIRTRVSESNRFSPAAQRQLGIAFASEYTRHRERLLPVLNTNTVDTQLKRQAIMQEVIRAFATRLLPLNAFSTVLGGVVLEGTDVVEVPFIALHGTASTDFSSSYTMGDSASDNRPVTVDKRKYQALSWTSSELRRQPFLLMREHLAQRVAKLGVDVFSNVLSVVTSANYSTAAFTGADSGFDKLDVLTIRKVCQQANWPDMGRSLILNGAYDAALLGDTGISSADLYGGSEAIREGRIPRIYGFDYYTTEAVPANSENLVGMAVHKSAILFANAPITPTDEVMQQLSQYEVIVDPVTGATFEFRRWGSPDSDATKQVVECNYGFAKGDGAALKRITSA